MTRHISLILLVPLMLFAIRGAWVGLSVGDAIGILSYCAIFGFVYWLKDRKGEKANKDIYDRLDEIGHKVDKLSLHATFKR